MHDPCISEPTEGVDTTIVSIVLCQINNNSIGNNNNDQHNNSKNATKTILSRRFNSDDPVLDLLNWLGCYGTIFQEREWCLRDKYQYPPSPTGCSMESDLNKTLQYVGCWPSGLELDVSDEKWRESGSVSVDVCDARGLAVH